MSSNEAEKLFVTIECMLCCWKRSSGATLADFKKYCHHDHLTRENTAIESQRQKCDFCGTAIEPHVFCVQGNFIKITACSQLRINSANNSCFFLCNNCIDAGHHTFYMNMSKYLTDIVVINENEAFTSPVYCSGCNKQLTKFHYQ